MLCVEKGMMINMGERSGFFFRIDFSLSSFYLVSKMLCEMMNIACLCYCNISLPLTLGGSVSLVTWRVRVHPLCLSYSRMNLRAGDNNINVHLQMDYLPSLRGSLDPSFSLTTLKINYD